MGEKINSILVEFGAKCILLFFGHLAHRLEVTNYAGLAVQIRATDSVCSAHAVFKIN